MRIAICIVIVLLLAACQSSRDIKVIFPDKVYQHLEWSTDELKKDIAIRNLHRSMDASTHLIRLKGNEFPYYHDYHDLNVSVISGTSTIHFADHDVTLESGDVIFIPRGALHWAENTDAIASVVFAVFSPAFDGKDKRIAE